MKLKYQEEINNCDNNDLSSFCEKERLSYRWVFEDINDIRNFQPKYLLDTSIKRNDACGWALSFYETEQHAKKKIDRLLSIRQNLYKKLGTHIAEGILKITDGISNNSNSERHFDLFEYENITLNLNFKIVTEIIKSDD